MIEECMKTDQTDDKQTVIRMTRAKQPTAKQIFQAQMPSESETEQ